MNPALGLGVGLGHRLGGSLAPQFSPLSLFLNGEVGAWYDPSDLTTLFQDAAGTTPVTAAGQVVGLMLDKSRGLALGADLETDNWSAPSTGVTYSAGTFTFDGVTSQTNTVFSTNTPSAPIVAGKTYQVTFTIFQNTTLAVGVDVGGTLGDAQTAPGTYTRLIVATSNTGPQVRFRNSVGARTGSMGNISVRELPGNHATQSGATSVRPIYRVDAGGRPYLEFDGIDDWLQTSTITPGVDKAQVFAGVRKLRDASYPLVVEHSTTANSNNGAFAITASGAVSGSAGWTLTARGTTSVQAQVGSGYASPVTNVVTGLSDISNDSAVLRVNGAQVASNTADQGTGNYLAYPLYIGRRAGTSLPFNGNLYGLIVRFGANLSTSQISNAERWLARKTGVSI